jgi:hypothetical protein
MVEHCTSLSMPPRHPFCLELGVYAVCKFVSACRGYMGFRRSRLKRVGAGVEGQPSDMYSSSRSPAHRTTWPWASGDLESTLPLRRTRPPVAAAAHCPDHPCCHLNNLYARGSRMPDAVHPAGGIVALEVRRVMCAYGWMACTVRRGVLLAMVVLVGWLVPARSWASSSR